MKPIDTLRLRAIEVRARLAELATAEVTEETRSELDTLKTEYADNEQRQAALIISGDTPDPIETHNDAEGHEFRQLLESSDFSRYVAAAMAGNGVSDGAERELNKHLGIADNYFPLRMLANGVEERAIIAGEAMESQGTWLDRVFFGTAAERVGISFRPVPPGVSAYPVTTAGGSPLQRGRTEAQAASTYTVAVTEIRPARRAVHGVYSIEDDMRLPGLSEAIERDMRASMTESVDLAVFQSDTGANENVADITGMRTSADVTEFSLTQAQKVSAVEILKKFLAYVDGTYAASMSDIRIVSSVGTNVLLHGTVHAATVDNETVAQFLMRSGMNWTVRGGIDTNTANGDFGAYIGLNRGIEGAGIAAVWEQAQLIRDPYTGADSGEVSLTLNYLWQLAFPRGANFKRMKFVT